MKNTNKKPTPKTQRQLNLSFQEPYVNPDTGKSFGNPNPETLPTEKRGNQQSFRDDNTKPFSLGLKDLDEALLYYMSNIIKPSVYQNGVAQKVPVIYGSPERWKQVQKDGFYRDKTGKIMMPLILFKRTDVAKNRSLTRKLDANSPSNLEIFTKDHNFGKTYDSFNIKNNIKPKKQYYVVVVPDYVNLTYEVTISTYYMEQLNGLIEKFNYASDSYWGDPERFKFRARIDNFPNSIEIQNEGERIVRSTFTLKLYGYIIPQVTQKEISVLKKQSQASKIKFDVEVVSDINNI
jgi:hypothetical protein